MKRLLRFFSLMALRTLAVATIVLWGVTQVQILVATTEVSGNGVGVVLAGEGYSAAVLTGQTVPTRIGRMKGHPLSWHEFGGGPKRHDSLLGCHYWRSRNGTFHQVGVTYPAALTYLLLLYGAVSFWSRK